MWQGGLQIVKSSSAALQGCFVLEAAFSFVGAHLICGIFQANMNSIGQALGHHGVGWAADTTLDLWDIAFITIRKNQPPIQEPLRRLLSSHA